MDPVIARFERLLRSMFQNPSTKEYEFTSSTFQDGDFASAWEELNDFLGKEGSSAEESWERRFRGEEPGNGRSGTHANAYRTPPEKLRPDYRRLGVEFGAPFDEVRNAYRNLMRQHHPDRHTQDPEAHARATRTTQQINESLQRIKAWELAKRAG
jgi:DnaJ-domain-containing protein 1